MVFNVDLHIKSETMFKDVKAQNTTSFLYSLQPSTPHPLNLREIGQHEKTSRSINASPEAPTKTREAIASL